MQVVHEADGTHTVIATTVEVADGPFSRGMGLMFRRSIPDGFALVFTFDRQSPRPLHMVFVPFGIDALWLCDTVVQRVASLRPWTGYGRAVADTVIELPAGAAADVTAGDRVYIEGDDGSVTTCEPSRRND